MQALLEYGGRLDSKPGFTARRVAWRIDLTASGDFVGVLPLGDGKKGERLDRCPDMHNMNAGGRAHFLIESSQSAVLFFKKDEDEKNIERGTLRHKFFRALLEEASNSLPQIRGIIVALKSDYTLDAIRGALTEHKAKPSDWVSWRVGEVDPREDVAVQAWWQQWRTESLGETSEARSGRSAANMKTRCLLTGELTTPLATHPKISGLAGVGGLGTGDVMVGFDKSAFCSFGFDQSANAAMSAAAAQQYADALNKLIAESSRKFGNTLVVHWFKEQVRRPDDPFAFLDGLELEEQADVAAVLKARSLLESIRRGTRNDLGSNRYYALTLSGASGRVMVRDWMEGRFEDLLQNVDAWFSDLEIVGREGDRTARNPKFMALAGALVRDLKDLPPSITSSLWKAAVARTAIPRSIMAQALARFRADLVDKNQPPLNSARVGLIKAYFIRRIPRGDSNVTRYLNPDHPNPAYHCGRLLAVLSRLQKAALGDVGAGVVQRFYVSASQTPGLILGRLVANARNHLGKLDGGLAFWFEEQIASVMGRLGDGAPRTLDLEGQGLFALGYYQQLATMRARTKEESSITTSETKGAAL